MFDSESYAGIRNPRPLIACPSLQPWKFCGCARTARSKGQGPFANDSADAAPATQSPVCEVGLVLPRLRYTLQTIVLPGRYRPIL